MKRVTRTRGLTAEESKRYAKVREQVKAELPALIERHHQRTEFQEQLARLCEQLKRARQQKGLSLADVTARTGMDPSAISKLENGQRVNPTFDTLIRYAEVVGKHLKLELIDA